MDREQRVPDVSVVVPLYQNSETVAELADRVLVAITSSGRTAEIVFVDDACPNGSGQAAVDVARTRPAVWVIRLAHNVGQHRAVLTGVTQATGTAIVVMDGDLQDCPEGIPDLVAALTRRGGVVFATRHVPYQPQGRMLTGLLFKRLLHLVAGVPKGAGVFMAFDRNVAARVLAFRGPRPYLVGMVCLVGAPVGTLPVEREARLSNRSAYGSWGIP